MSREDPHFRLRLPEGLRDKLKLASEANRRSVNAEVVARLLDSFSSKVVPSLSEDLIAPLVRRIVREEMAGMASPSTEPHG